MPTRSDTHPDAERTHPDAERTHIRLLREAGMARRLGLAFKLTQQALALSDEALRRRHPELSSEERLLHTVALRYGEDLARCLRADLERRR